MYSTAQGSDSGTFVHAAMTAHTTAAYERSGSKSSIETGRSVLPLQTCCTSAVLVLGRASSRQQSGLNRRNPIVHIRGVPRRYEGSPLWHYLSILGLYVDRFKSVLAQAAFDVTSCWRHFSTRRALDNSACSVRSHARHCTPLCHSSVFMVLQPSHTRVIDASVRDMRSAGSSPCMN